MRGPCTVRKKKKKRGLHLLLPLPNPLAFLSPHLPPMLYNLSGQVNPIVLTINRGDSLSFVSSLDLVPGSDTHFQLPTELLCLSILQVFTIQCYYLELSYSIFSQQICFSTCVLSSWLRASSQSHELDPLESFWTPLSFTSFYHQNAHKQFLN